MPIGKPILVELFSMLLAILYKYKVTNEDQDMHDYEIRPNSGYILIISRESTELVMKCRHNRPILRINSIYFIMDYYFMKGKLLE